MTKLEYIKQKCIEANPEIMELKFGCDIKVNLTNGGGVEATFVGFRNPDIIYFSWAKFHKNKESVQTELLNRIKVMGRPIQLADVLMAIGERYGDWVGIDSEGYFIEMTNTATGLGLSSAWNEKGTHRINHWDLTKALDDQPEPAINYLADLLGFKE
jgi:hypothetical protein